MYLMLYHREVNPFTVHSIYASAFNYVPAIATPCCTAMCIWMYEGNTLMTIWYGSVLKIEQSWKENSWKEEEHNQLIGTRN